MSTFSNGKRRRRGLAALLCLSSPLTAADAFQTSSLASSRALIRSGSTLRGATSTRLCGAVDPNNFVEIDVRYGKRNFLHYDAELERYILGSSTIPDHDDHMSPGGYINGDSQIKGFLRKASPSRILRKTRTKVFPFLKRSFFPDGVTPSYYRFVKFRVIQRFINSIVHVLGTQSLLMGLGLKSKALGLSAALNWVLKDALGKLVRLVWASRMGGKFDSDAKRWRFRSSMVYAFGNALEIVTYVNPQLFLLWATLSNCCKQVSMLTSSSTRTAIYNSFRTAENIADITAKGEAQIAVVDLLGIATGVMISRTIGMKVANVVGVYLVLQVTEIYCLYRMINAVEFRVLNFERMVQVIQSFVISKNNSEETNALPTPTEMAKTEKIFLPPKHLARRTIAFGSLGRAKLAPNELQDLLKMFENERFLLVVGQDVKNTGLTKKKPWRQQQREPLPEENCHVVLHANATNADIVKSTLALTLLRQSLKVKSPDSSVRTRDCWPEIQQAYEQCDKWFPQLLRSMSQQGWAPPARFMFGRVTMRAEWPLTPRSLRAEMAAANTTTTIATIANVTEIMPDEDLEC